MPKEENKIQYLNRGERVRGEMFCRKISIKFLCQHSEDLQAPYIYISPGDILYAFRVPFAPKNMCMKCESSSEVGTRQGELEGGTRQGESEVDTRQGESEMGTIQGESALSTRQGESEVGTRHGESEVGARQGVTEVGTRQGESEVATRQGESMDRALNVALETGGASQEVFCTITRFGRFILSNSKITILTC